MARSTYTYTRPLNEAELIAHLHAEDKVLIKVNGIRWQAIERQIENLGFGDRFFVSAMTSKRGESCKIEPCQVLERRRFLSVHDNTAAG